MPRFAFCAPVSVAEASDLLAQADGTTKVLAGGTDLVVGIKQGIEQPRRIVWLGKIPGLRRMEFSPAGGLRIGAMCTLSQVRHAADVRRHYPSLERALGAVASPQIRNRATIGGNLCLDTRCFYYDQSEFWRGSLGYCLKHGGTLCSAAPAAARCSAVFCSDLAPILIALGASVSVAGAGGGRTLPLAELYRDDGAAHLALQPSELLTEITVPYDAAATSVFAKLRRRGTTDFALVNLGIALSGPATEARRRARIVVGAVAARPLVLDSAAEGLCEGEITDERIDETAAAVAAAVHPVPNVDGAVGYRKKMARVMVRHALRELLGPAHASRGRGRPPR